MTSPLTALRPPRPPARIDVLLTLALAAAMIGLVFAVIAALRPDPVTAPSGRTGPAAGTTAPSPTAPSPTAPSPTAPSPTATGAPGPHDAHDPDLLGRVPR